MNRFVSLTSLASILVLAGALPACTASADEVDATDSALAQLPALDVGPTVRAFQFDPAAKRDLQTMIETERRNAAAKAEHDAKVTGARAAVRAAKQKVKDEKRAWKAIAPKKRCWIFFRCTDWSGATKVEAAREEKRQAKSFLHSIPSFVPEPVERAADLVDRVARQHDPAGYGRVLPMSHALVRLAEPVRVHARHVAEVHETVREVTRLVMLRQAKLDGLLRQTQGGPSAADGEDAAEEAVDGETELLEAKLDDANLSVRGLGDSFFVLQSALRNDPEFSAMMLPALPAPVASDLTNFPSDLSDLEAQAAHTRELLSALARIDGGLGAQGSSVSSLSREIDTTSEDVRRWLGDYLTQAESRIRGLARDARR